ncbi:hypothetical protein COW94_01900 [Candidatus Peregrinibacteria bacterium CG22_combo_CG10-13_8_21_14_all_44_10]|nr:MAG: hypothetical protein AUK45_01660 [Candidatus Peregrinibacteria bacterium CG2_30_44_17]PIP66423.1 MAG: hypothetical protein COW94_01900 [Candidatus Peregrinibacteria bacterium CG22_combo_CG10-13_8_21_14_all_44_10]PIS03764.1 MAG: hypothetical protein COT83_04300 [Candidatus Peregrinibacteria bacterium CG10_big_fil_rev_8_21_14_0_10_44_7]PIX80034.1 MAG: hypothetical protein COZ35_02035 [Candidatus Peregrinibacteria bacterium CG_4_10_14_3_um_filter_44_21]PJB89383.1 MAG: hypothetical protein 
MKKVFAAILTLVAVTCGLTAIVLLAEGNTLLTNFFGFENAMIEEEDTGKIATDFDYDDYINKGQLLIDNGYYTLAINEFTEAAREKPAASEPYVLIGQTHLTEKNYDKALANFETALEKNPDNMDAVIGVSQSYIHLNEFGLARETLDGAHYPDRPEFKYYQAMLFAYDGEYDRSEKYFAEALETTNEEIQANTQLFLDAYTEYALEQGGQESHLRTLLAKAATDANQYELATTILYQVLSESPTYRDAWILLGYAYLNLQQYEDSASAFEEALELDTTKPETNYFLSLAYFGQDRYADCITYLELALVYGFEPQIQIYQKLAETYFLLEDYESATRNYEQVLEINDEDINSFIRPIWINMDYLDNTARSFDLAAWAIKSHPDEAMSYNLMGWVMIEYGDMTEAREHLEEAIAMDETLAAAYLNLGTIDEVEGSTQSAKENYKKAYNLGQNDSVGTLAAEKYNTLLQSEQAEVQ